MGNNPSTRLRRWRYRHILPFTEQWEAFSAQQCVPGLLQMEILEEAVRDPNDLRRLKHNPLPGSCYWYVFVTRDEVSEAQRWDLMDRLGVKQAMFNGKEEW